MRVLATTSTVALAVAVAVASVVAVAPVVGFLCAGAEAMHRTRCCPDQTPDAASIAATCCTLHVAGGEALVAEAAAKVRTDRPTAAVFFSLAPSPATSRADRLAEIAASDPPLCPRTASSVRLI